VSVSGKIGNFNGYLGNFSTAVILVTFGLAVVLVTLAAIFDIGNFTFNGKIISSCSNIGYW
jgi:hypothetical protein